MQQTIDKPKNFISILYIFDEVNNKLWEHTGESGTVPLVLLAHEGRDEIIGLGIILENVIEFTMEVGFLGEAINELLEIHLTLDK